MVIGGGMKGHSHNNGGVNRGRSYGLILLLGFGLAVFGIMVIHKLRESRIYNVIVQEKDRQLNSYQLLLQKEREFAKETKRKLGDIKVRLHTLRIQKLERDNRISELQSTISSLRDEEKLIEIAFDEKQNEINLLKAGYIEKENNQSKALTKALKEKEAQIQDLKRQLHILSENPTILAVNSTANASKLSRDESSSISVKLTRNQSSSGNINVTVNNKVPRDEDLKLKIDYPIKLESHKGKTHVEEIQENRANTNGTTILLHEKLEAREEMKGKVEKIVLNLQAKKELHSKNSALV